MIQIKTPAEIEKMRVAGLVVAEGLAEMSAAVAPGVSTADLDAIGREVLARHGAVSSFLNYHGTFPAVICASVNDEIVHGIPKPSRRLREGDVVSIDYGAIVDGWHGDAAVTVPCGAIDPEAQQLLDVCEQSLWRGMAAARLGGRLSDISHAVEAHVDPYGYGIVEGYGGHGIGTEMHQDPHVLNYGRPGRGPKLVKGLALAIEPMINMGRHETRELPDGWTVVTADGSVSAHFEHTFTLTDDGPWVLTAPDGGAARLAEMGVLAHA
ncbi:MAG TPA: type I methionyl aminopeptidase [Mycobacteriales bacterium]